MKCLTYFLIGIGIVAFLALLLWIIALAIATCWNFVMPAVFGLPVITKTQALVLKFVSILLMGRFY